MDPTNAPLEGPITVKLAQVVQPLIEFMNIAYPSPLDSYYSSGPFGQITVPGNEVWIDANLDMQMPEINKRALWTITRKSGSNSKWTASHMSSHHDRENPYTSPLRFRLMRPCFSMESHIYYELNLVVDHLGATFDTEAAERQIALLIGYIEDEQNLDELPTEVRPMFEACPDRIIGTTTRSARRGMTTTWKMIRARSARCRTRRVRTQRKAKQQRAVPSPAKPAAGQHCNQIERYAHRTPTQHHTGRPSQHHAHGWRCSRRPLAGRELHDAIKALPFNQQAELLALVTLGRSGGHNSFNVAFEAASRQHPDHIAGMIAEKSNLGAHLAKGLKRHNRQS